MCAKHNKKNLPEALLTMPLAAAVALAAVELYLTPRTVVLVAERRVERNILDVTMGITTKNGVLDSLNVLEGWR